MDWGDGPLAAGGGVNGTPDCSSAMAHVKRNILGDCSLLDLPKGYKRIRDTHAIDKLTAVHVFGPDHFKLFIEIELRSHVIRRKF